MPGPDPGFGALDALGALSVIAASAFLVSWVLTDLLHVGRTLYVGALTVAVGVLGGAYLSWSGTEIADVSVSGWGWGVVGGLLAAGAVAPLVRRLPPGPRPRGGRLVSLLLWEGLVYGIAEAVLLAALPALVVWHASSARGWTDGGWSRVAAGSLATAAALVVILVHHLGYGEFRTHRARPKLVGALVTCGLQAVAFLVTGTVVAPVLAHVLLHAQMIMRGVELPPVYAEAGQAHAEVPDALGASPHPARA